MENVIVAIIVGLALAYLVKRCLGVFRPGKQDACGCGCADCGQTSNCGPDAARHPRDPDGNPPKAYRRLTKGAPDVCVRTSV